MRNNKFKSPQMNQRYLYNKTHRINNNYHLSNDDSDPYNNIIETNINNLNYYNNLKQIPRYNINENTTRLYNMEQEYNPEINNYFNNLNNDMNLIKQENKSLLNKIKKYKKQIISRDNEIINYKQKVRALLTQVQDKNYDLSIKKDTIIKLSEEKDLFFTNHCQTPTNNMNNKNELYKMKVQLQYALKEKEKYIQQIKYLNTIIQKMNKTNIRQNKINNDKNHESEKSSEYNEPQNKINNNFYVNNAKNNLITTSFFLYIEKSPNNQILHSDEENKNNINRNNDDEYINILNEKFEEFKKSKEIELNELMKEIEEKNILLKKKEKMINDYILNIKAIKEENINLKNNLNKRIVELNEYKLKYDDDKIMDTEDKKIEIDLMIRENKELKDKLNTINEEKLNNERKIEELNEDIESLKEANDNYKKQLNEKNDIINKINDEINNLKESQKKYENINEININMKQNIEKLNKELNTLQIQNKQLANEKIELMQKMMTVEDNYNISKKEINDIKILNTELIEKLKKCKTTESKEENKINDNNDINELKKENDVLQKRVIQLNNLIEELNSQINELNIKYSNIKKENINLKEASQAILEKQKKEMEQKDLLEKISPETHYIITKKTYNNLIWYLISIINPNDKTMIKNAGYENYKWVNELSIPKSQINKYNKFEDDETKINDLYTYIRKMQNKLEQKEEEINKKNYENQKLNDKLQNKSSNIQVGKLFLTKVLNNDKSNNNNNNKSNSNQNTLKNNANSYLGGNNGDLEKYKNLLDKLNDYDEREKKYQNEISKLKSQLNLQSGMKEINNIPFDSDFVDDDIEDKKVIDLLPDNKINNKEKNKDKDEGNFLGILNDVPGEDSNDEIKGLKNLISYLKKMIKEKDKILNDLLEQVQEIFKELKWNIKTNKIVTKILTILGYTQEIIKIVTDNKKGFNFDFKLELKK